MDIKPGTPVTRYVGSDSYPGTIVRVSASGKTFWYKKDTMHARKCNAYTEDQSWIYGVNPQAEEIRAHLTKRGYWKDSRGSRLHIGERRAYMDPSF